MEQQSLVPETPAQLSIAQPSGPTLLLPSYSELFKRSGLTKREQVMGAVTRLSVALGQPQDAARLRIYADQLEGLESGALRTVFERAEADLKFFPVPSELLEMAGAHRAQVELRKVDEAWMWLQDYLAKHGADSHDFFEKRPDSGPCDLCHDTGFQAVRAGASKVVRCECRQGKRVPAPSIPDRISYALRQMGNTVTASLERISTTEARYQGRVRGEFNEAFKRAEVQP